MEYKMQTDFRICPAGKVIPTNFTLADCMKDYKRQDVVDAYKHEKQLFYEKDNKKWWKKSIPQKKRELPEIFGWPVQTRFQAVMEDLKDTGYESYWIKELGKRADILPLPFSIKAPVSITFGKPTETVESAHVKELLNFYTYFDEPTPREKALARRKLPVYPDRKKNKCKDFVYDPRGMCMKICMNWVTDKFSTGDSIFADFQEAHGSKLEKAIIRHQPIYPEDLDVN